MTMAGLAAFPDLFAAGANLFGIVNFATFFRNTEPWMAAISKTEYGDPETEAAMLRDLSPIHRLDRGESPDARPPRGQRHELPGHRGRAGRRAPEGARRPGEVRPLPRRRARLEEDAEPDPLDGRGDALVREVPEGRSLGLTGFDGAAEARDALLEETAPARLDERSEEADRRAVEDLRVDDERPRRASPA